MWPKLLIELLPHFARLVPTAEKFMASRGTADKTQETAISTMSDELRGDLSQVAAMHAGMERILQTQSAQVAEMSVDVTRTRIGIETLEARLGRLENTAALAMRLVAVALLLLASTLGLLAMVLIHLSRH